MHAKVIHTLTKPHDRIYAGIYVQFPEQGLIDRNGRPLRALYEDIGVREVPNKAISSCLRSLFDRCPDLEYVEYQTPRGELLKLSREQELDDIRHVLAAAGNYIR